MHLPFLVRQLMRSSKQALVFVLCVTLSLITLTALSGFSQSVRSALLKDARKLHAGDIIIRSYSPISPQLKHAVAEMERQGRIQQTHYFRFYSVVRRTDDSASLLASLKVVGKRYPF